VTDRMKDLRYALILLTGECITTGATRTYCELTAEDALDAGMVAPSQLRIKDCFTGQLTLPDCVQRQMVKSQFYYVDNAIIRYKARKDLSRGEFKLYNCLLELRALLRFQMVDTNRATV
jgi:hypothetical protein